MTTPLLAGGEGVGTVPLALFVHWLAMGDCRRRSLAIASAANRQTAGHSAGALHTVSADFCGAQ